MDNTIKEAPTKQPETASQLILQVRRYTRRKFTAEDKIRIVMEGLKREVPVVELCRRERIVAAIYYSWLKDFMEAGKARLKGDMTREANRDEVQKLHQENERLKTIVADQSLEILVLKKSLLS
jgi:transposase